MKKPYIFFDFAGTLVKMRPVTLLVERKLLKILATKYCLGIITGARKRETYNILNKIQIKNLFSIIITSDDSLFKKPDPKLFPKVKILSYIGDSNKDEVLAKNAKVTFFRVNNRYNINSIVKKLI
jgi:phosphoglycolate phosphatase-like HAD superfamily hydrolase